MDPRRQALRRLLAPLAFAFMAACGASEVGEECDDAGDMDECEDGAICTNDEGGAVCRALCKEQEDCAQGEDCNGVSDTSFKSCQPDKLR